MTTFEKLNNLTLPIIAAPMFLVSCPEMAIACHKAGIVGSFPAHSTRTREVFHDWIKQVHQQYLTNTDIPYAINLVVHPTNKRYEGDLELCLKYEVPIILTSKGAPGEVCEKIHSYGGLVFHDVASKRHTEKALAAGVDGVIAVAGGAGGHTGSLNPFALVNEIRSLTDKPIILGGSITNGKDILAAQAMGATFAYMGTRFIATKESMATDAYKQCILESTGTDILVSAALDGAPAAWIKSSLIENGVDLTDLANTPKGQLYQAERMRGRYTSIFSAGQGVDGIKDIPTVAELVDRLTKEYQAACESFKSIILVDGRPN